MLRLPNVSLTQGGLLLLVILQLDESSRLPNRMSCADIVFWCASASAESPNGFVPTFLVTIHFAHDDVMHRECLWLLATMKISTAFSLPQDHGDLLLRRAAARLLHQGAEWRRLTRDSGTASASRTIAPPPSTRGLPEAFQALHHQGQWQLRALWLQADLVG